jgi:hypothetical protein
MRVTREKRQLSSVMLVVVCVRPDSDSEHDASSGKGQVETRNRHTGDREAGNREPHGMWRKQTSSGTSSPEYGGQVQDTRPERSGMGERWKLGGGSQSGSENEESGAEAA